MAWRIRARGVESCSCKMACRCTLGPAEPDQGWCSGALAWEIVEGDSDGVDLSGVKFVLIGDLPGDFLGGIEVAKVYVDEQASEDQRREIDLIVRGEKGGLWGGMKEAIGRFLPTETASITMTHGDSPSVEVSGVGQMTLQPVLTESGKRAAVVNAPIAEAFGQETIELAVATGAKFSASDMRSWESLGYGATSEVTWSG